jgi:hypothetical protein
MVVDNRQEVVRDESRTARRRDRLAALVAAEGAVSERSTGYSHERGDGWETDATAVRLALERLSDRDREILLLTSSGPECVTCPTCGAAPAIAGVDGDAPPGRATAWAARLEAAGRLRRGRDDGSRAGAISRWLGW